MDTQYFNFVYICFKQIIKTLNAKTLNSEVEQRTSKVSNVKGLNDRTIQIHSFFGILMKVIIIP